MNARQGNHEYWIRLVRLAAVALALGTLGALLTVGVLASALYTRALTHPGCGDMGLTPGDVGIDGTEDVTYLSHDGLTLRAWYLPPQDGVVVILLPGLGGGRDGMLREGAILARYGYGLLMTELRSCAHPSGQTTLGYRESLDLQEAVSWVRGQPDVGSVGVLGYSLGGVTAILGAARDERIEAVAAEGGFYDLAADITDEVGNPRLWETPLHQAILLFFWHETGVRADAISPISVVGRISPRPLLLIYGDLEAEKTRPHEQLAAAGEPKDLWIVQDCGHGQYLSKAPEEWERRVVAFFDGAFSE